MKHDMRVLVTGGRGYGDVLGAFKVLDTLHSAWRITCVVHGAAHGADAIAADWANDRGVPTDPYPITADEWASYGRRAGPRRNARMLQTQPDLVIAFPGGRGTADCIKQARKLGIGVYEISGKVANASA